MTSLPKGVTLLLEHIEPVLAAAEAQDRGFRYTEDEKRAIRSVRAEVEAVKALSGSVEPTDPRSDEG